MLSPEGAHGSETAAASGVGAGAGGSDGDGAGVVVVSNKDKEMAGDDRGDGSGREDEGKERRLSRAKYISNEQMEFIKECKLKLENMSIEECQARFDRIYDGSVIWLERPRVERDASPSAAQVRAVGMWWPSKMFSTMFLRISCPFCARNGVQRSVPFDSGKWAQQPREIVGAQSTWFLLCRHYRCKGCNREFRNTRDDVLRMCPEPVRLHFSVLLRKRLAIEREAALSLLSSWLLSPAMALSAFREAHMRHFENLKQHYLAVQGMQEPKSLSRPEFAEAGIGAGNLNPMDPEIARLAEMAGLESPSYEEAQRELAAEDILRSTLQDSLPHLRSFGKDKLRFFKKNLGIEYVYELEQLLQEPLTNENVRKWTSDKSQKPARLRKKVENWKTVVMEYFAPRLAEAGFQSVEDVLACRQRRLERSARNEEKIKDLEVQGIHAGAEPEETPAPFGDFGDTAGYNGYLIGRKFLDDIGHDLCREIPSLQDVDRQRLIQSGFTDEQREALRFLAHKLATFEYADVFAQHTSDGMRGEADVEADEEADVEGDTGVHAVDFEELPATSDTFQGGENGGGDRGSKSMSSAAFQRFAILKRLYVANSPEMPRESLSMDPAAMEKLERTPVNPAEPWRTLENLNPRKYCQGCHRPRQGHYGLAKRMAPGIDCPSGVYCVLPKTTPDISKLPIEHFFSGSQSRRERLQKIHGQKSNDDHGEEDTGSPLDEPSSPRSAKRQRLGSNGLEADHVEDEDEQAHLQHDMGHINRTDQASSLAPDVGEEEDDRMLSLDKVTDNEIHDEDSGKEEDPYDDNPYGEEGDEEDPYDRGGGSDDDNDDDVDDEDEHGNNDEGGSRSDSDDSYDSDDSDEKEDSDEEEGVEEGLRGAKAAHAAIELMHSGVHKIDLGNSGNWQSSNVIGPAGAAAFAAVLATNNSLTSLSLAWNDIGTNGAVSLTKSLRTNTSISILTNIVSLSGNNIGDEGAFQLGEILGESESLTELV
ncbi:Hypothetical Protein FCC1311_110232 [Hondaea fermentalgiana]|uniref:DUF6729 domain-containing protein n=1 Tax=Hondaea fermentalgiana TaxID=2315210 RepID=A0A2R5H1V1_9STRA|nr:Hypothetical Protein FCC1311_110232 [Hondaea fermentalgiana]|eukprot:GBG34801.1 Hypothetical Protein FCC1311_110232 [Hondaea fermentalgiana]